MGLKITGSVKRGGAGIAAKVRLRIFKDKDAQRTGRSEYEIETYASDGGDFYHEIVDSTGIQRDYAKMILWGEVLNHPRILPAEVLIVGKEVDLQFPVPIPPWMELRHRLARTAQLDGVVYEEIAVDPDAFKQGLLVAAVASFAMGGVLGANGGLPGLLVVGAGIFIALGLLAALMYLFGTKVLAAPAARASFPKFLGPIGFATLPILAAAMVLALDAAAGGLPGRLLPFLLVALFVWQLLALTVAVRQALSLGKQWARPLAAVLVPMAVMLAVAWAATR